MSPTKVIGKLAEPGIELDFPNTRRLSTLAHCVLTSILTNPAPCHRSTISLFYQIVLFYQNVSQEQRVLLPSIYRMNLESPLFQATPL